MKVQYFRNLSPLSRYTVLILLYILIKPEDSFILNNFIVNCIMAKTRKKTKSSSQSEPRVQNMKTKVKANRKNGKSGNHQMAKLNVGTAGNSKGEIAVHNPPVAPSSFMQTFLGTKLASKTKFMKKSILMKRKSDSSEVISAVSAHKKSLEIKLHPKLEDITHEEKGTVTSKKKSKKRKRLIQDEENFVSETVESYTMKPCTDDAHAFVHCWSDKDSDKPIITHYSSFTAVLVPDTDEALILVAANESVVLRGKYYLSSLKGVALIYGYNINQQTDWCPVYSANNTSYLSIKASCNEDTSLEKLENYVAKHRLQKSVKPLLTDSSCCVFLIKEMTDPICDAICAIGTYKKLFSSTLPSPTDALSMIGLTEAAATDNLLKIGDQFKEMEKHFRLAVKQSKQTGDKAPSMVLCGGQNVGKSTLCRFIINSALNLTDRVAFLECDVGQTEVTPPGCISLSLITKPFLGPPFTHLIANRRSPSPDSSKGFTCQPIKQFYFGHITPSDNPEVYIKCLQETINCYHGYSDVPLIVNTMGWNQGLGLMLMIDTLKMVKPSFVAQLKSLNEHRNFPGLTVGYMKDKKGWLNDLKTPDDLNWKRFVLDSMVHPSSVPKQYTPVDQRDLALFSYFHGGVSTAAYPGGDTSAYPGVSRPVVGLLQLWDAVPYVVPWSSVGIHILHTAVQYEFMLYSINASVVGLCTVPEDMLVDGPDTEYPKRLLSTEIVPCDMFGIVRGIDPVKRVFHIISPEPLSRLEKVNLLLAGAVKVPRHLMIRESGMGRLPYIDMPLMSQGMPQRKCHQRLRLKNRN